jgi:hypothetical protein
LDKGLCGVIAERLFSPDQHRTFDWNRSRRTRDALFDEVPPNGKVHYIEILRKKLLNLEELHVPLYSVLHVTWFGRRGTTPAA